MKEAAKAFAATHDVSINMVAGPTPRWVDQAKEDADVVFSGAENMMSDFAKALPGAFDLKNAQPMYLRPVAILVRRGNPKRVTGFRDLLRPGMKVLAVAGAGQTGLWEDVAGRTGDLAILRQFRTNLLSCRKPRTAPKRESAGSNSRTSMRG
jgi:accessory colonization factor AcfC